MNAFLKILLVLGILLLIGMASCHADAVPSDLLKAIHKTETSGRTGAIVGDNGKALGPFQIHKEYWQDSGVKGKYSDCADYDYSVRVVTAYLNRYGAKYLKGKNYEALARIHNGGPSGYQKAATLGYWLKVKKYLAPT